jgi:hypothetical protein
MSIHLPNEHSDSNWDPFMAETIDLQVICTRLQQLGYAREKYIRLYGEEFHWISNPVPDGEGFAIEGTTTSGSRRKVRIPLTLVHSVKKEFGRRER